MSEKMNIKEFAELAGVSTATVSRVFSHQDKVAPRTRERIIELARKYRFRPNQVSQASFGGKTKSVGVLLCRLSCSYFADIAVGIQKEMLGKNYLPIIIDLREDGERAGIKRLVDHRVDGIIISIADQTLTKADISEITHNNLPVVTVDTTILKDAYDNVCSDDIAGGRIAGDLLYANGHRHIGYAYIGSADNPGVQDRLTGLRQSLADKGLTVDPIDIRRLPPAMDLRDKLFLDYCEYLRGPERPTAIFAYSDNVAPIIYQAANLAGLKLPDDLSIIGHAGLDFSDLLLPRLTTIYQDARQIGATAAGMLFERINGFNGPPRKAMNEVKLVERDSVININ